MSKSIALQKLDHWGMWVICAVLAYSAGLLGMAIFSGEHLGTWVWARHQNQFSWYSRPLFIMPAAYFAYRRKLGHVLGCMALMFTSLFWFGAPAKVSPEISQYLAWERQMFFDAGDVRPLATLTLTVILFLFLVFYACWHRNLWYGVLVVNAGTILKIVVSLTLGQKAGAAAILPSLSSMMILNLCAFGLWRFLRGRSKL